MGHTQIEVLPQIPNLYNPSERVKSEIMRILMFVFI